MITYQDLLAVGEDPGERMKFVRQTINKYMADSFYKTAKVAWEYYEKKSPDLANYTKVIYDQAGMQIPDIYSSNYKVGRHFFRFFITQEVQYLLSNGAFFKNETTKDKLEDGRMKFDPQLIKCARYGTACGVGWGFWNFDHLDVFSPLEFCALPDEDNGAYKAGIRWWQIDRNKPFRATLYELDGYTEFIWGRKDEHGQVHDGEILKEKTPYRIVRKGTDVDGNVIYDGRNYETFPIVPLWGNADHQSELVGLREGIFCYEMIKSGFCDSVEEASFIYWSIHNAPGMDSRDMAEFLRNVRTNHIAKTEDSGSVAEPHQIETPSDSRETLLTRLERDLFKDAMALDPEYIAGGATTATQVKAAYENLDMKANDFEFEVITFVNEILSLAGIDDEPSFTRSRNINASEEVTTILAAAAVLDEEYVTRKILTILGDGDQADEMMERKEADELNRIPDMQTLQTLMGGGSVGGHSTQANGPDNQGNRGPDMD